MRELEKEKRVRRGDESTGADEFCISESLYPSDIHKMVWSVFMIFTQIPNEYLLCYDCLYRKLSSGQ